MCAPGARVTIVRSHISMMVVRGGAVTLRSPARHNRSNGPLLKNQISTSGAVVYCAKREILA
jgi:hypothetical protein